MPISIFFMVCLQLILDVYKVYQFVYILSNNVYKPCYSFPILVDTFVYLPHPLQPPIKYPLQFCEMLLAPEGVERAFDDVQFLMTVGQGFEKFLLVRKRRGWVVFADRHKYRHSQLLRLRQEIILFDIDNERPWNFLNRARPGTAFGYEPLRFLP